MSRNALFWGSALIVLGAALLLDNLGILPFPVWNLIGPGLLIVVGIFILFIVVTGPAKGEAQPLSIPLEGAPAAHVKISHGAGELAIHSGAGPGELVAGTFGGGVEHTSERDGSRQKVKLSSPLFSFMPWEWFGRNVRAWSIGLSRDIPLSLEIEAGASRSRLDLSGLTLSEVKLAVGASVTEVSLPAGTGTTRAKIEAGAASVDVRIPPEAAARIRWDGGLADLSVDRSRFIQSGNVFETFDFATAVNKLDIDIETGVGSVTVRS